MRLPFSSQRAAPASSLPCHTLSFGEQCFLGADQGLWDLGLKSLHFSAHTHPTSPMSAQKALPKMAAVMGLGCVAKDSRKGWKQGKGEPAPQPPSVTGCPVPQTLWLCPAPECVGSN